MGSEGECAVRCVGVPCHVSDALALYEDKRAHTTRGLRSVLSPVAASRALSSASLFCLCVARLLPFILFSRLCAPTLPLSAVSAASLSVVPSHLDDTLTLHLSSQHTFCLCYPTRALSSSAAQTMLGCSCLRASIQLTSYLYYPLALYTTYTPPHTRLPPSLSSQRISLFYRS